jgi:hypothetical protein
MDLTWKTSLPMLLWFAVLAVLNWAGLAEGFHTSLLIGVGWFLLIPVLAQSGASKAVTQWMQKAGMLAVFSAAFGFAASVLLNTGLWWEWIVDIGLIGSGFFALIGALLGFFKWD